jgi:hypothetical protein
MSDPQNLFNTPWTIFSRSFGDSNIREDGVANGLEGLSNERRANGSSGIATPERNHSATPSHRYWRRGNQVTNEIDNIPQVILVTNSICRVGDYAPYLIIRQSNRAANPTVKSAERIDSNSADAFDHIGFYESGLSTVTRIIADEQCGVRPSRLREKFDRRADTASSFNEQNVTRSQRFF